MDKVWCPKCRLPYRTSIFLTSEEWTSLYTEWTGPNMSVIQRFYCRGIDFCLSSRAIHSCYNYCYALGVPGEPVLVESEQDIFEIIDYSYKKPDERNL